MTRDEIERKLKAMRLFFGVKTLSDHRELLLNTRCSHMFCDNKGCLNIETISHNEIHGNYYCSICKTNSLIPVDNIWFA